MPSRDWKTCLFVEIGRPRQVADGRIDAAAEILENHGEITTATRPAGDGMWATGLVLDGGSEHLEERAQGGVLGVIGLASCCTGSLQGTHRLPPAGRGLSGLEAPATAAHISLRAQKTVCKRLGQHHTLPVTTAMVIVI